MYYPQTTPNPSFPQLEHEVLSLWKREGIFNKSIRGVEEFVFYDGPPFANGLPHYGHFLTGFEKDLVARYQTMKGKMVCRRFGWDCHGLPPEMESEKELKVSGKQQIEEFGIDKFNAHCRSSVLRYVEEWKHFVTRQARWVDFDNSYKTMDLSYMESVLWAFKTLYDRNLIYKAMRVMPYSWKCETPVSDFETRIDNAYREKQSKSVTIAVKLLDLPDALNMALAENFYFQDKLPTIRLLVWTTTPWTLPSNLAIAVGNEIEYSCFLKDNQCYIVASNLAAKYATEIGETCIATIKGAILVGVRYEVIFDYFANHARAFKILPADFVTTEDGTGAVHIAPGFGEDDYRLCEQYNIELVCPVDSSGKFTQPVHDFLDKHVFDANDDIISYLKQRGLWMRTEQYTHNYPHCWRTDTPLIYRAISSWYVKVTAFKDRMIEHNQKINWIPSHIKNGLFGKWLENARDWSISRNRFWGAPIPVWESDDPRYPCTEVYGSVEELERAFGVEIKDLHRPFIDTLVKQNPNDPTGISRLRRVPEVLDCWFESGSMPYAQVHYPFENKKWFDDHFPADFTTEYLAQTRGWFYTMIVLSTALFDKPPFLNCVCHGVVLGDSGQKLSKRLKNYPDPSYVFEEFGADAMRWFMISSQVMKGQDLVIDRKASGIADSMRIAIKPLWNAYNFFTLYANADSIMAVFDLSSNVLLDRYIIAKCIDTVNLFEKAMDAYDTASSARYVEEFLEILNNWYIRRARERFWRHEVDKDKISAYNTLYSVLDIICRTMAPLLPMITEIVYRGINAPFSEEKIGEKLSVHLAEFPSTKSSNKKIVQDDDNISTLIISDMERVRAACNAALRLRNDNGVRVRQPLRSVTFIGVTSNAFPDELRQLVLDEINVKEWRNIDSTQINTYANYHLRLNLPVLGKRIPGKIQEMIIASKAGKWVVDKNNVPSISGEILLHGEYTMSLEPKDEFRNVACAVSTNDAMVMLDFTIDECLIQEGIARDIVRIIQQCRKKINLDITDKIALVCYTNSVELTTAIELWSAYICEQAMATGLRCNAGDSVQDILVEDASSVIAKEVIEFADGRILVCLFRTY